MYELIKNPHNTLNQNLISFINIIEIVRIMKIDKFIYASSSSIFFFFSENDKQNIPVSVYGATKLCNEILQVLCKKFSYVRTTKIQAIGLRFFTIYGPFGRPDMAYFSFMNDLFKNRKDKSFQ